MRLIRVGEVPNGARGNGRKEKPVKTLSLKSRSNLAFLITETNIKFQSMLTLSYPKTFPLSGKTVKSHWNRLRINLQRWFENLSYVWVLEFQKRGAPHLHVLLSVVPTFTDRRRIAHKWAEITTKDNQEVYLGVYNVHKHAKAWEPIKKTDGAKRYILKYALKTYQKTVPAQFQDVGRFWGTSYDVRRNIPDPTIAIEADEKMVRTLLKGHSVESWENLPTILFGVDRPPPFENKIV